MDMRKVKIVIEMFQNQGVRGTEFTLNMGRVFLLLAENPGLTQKEMLNYLNIAPGNIARVVAALCEGAPKKSGLKLIAERSNPHDWRSSRYFLSNKGLELAARVVNL